MTENHSVVAIGATAPQPHAGRWGRHMKTNIPRFDDKVVSVVCANEDTGQLIYSPQFERQGGRMFIVGSVPNESSQDNWMEGLTTAIAWDTVQDYVVFDSMADFIQRLKSRKRRWPRKTIVNEPPRNRMKERRQRGKPQQPPP